MTEQVLDKLAIMEKLRTAGVWAQAEAYREEVRRRLRAEGKTKQEAIEGAWGAMCEKFLPLAEQATTTPGFQVVLPYGVESYDDLVDPDYQETDDAAQLRDAYRWIKEEFPRVVRDRPTSTVVDYRRCRTPPPVGLACKILETWAARAAARRDGLYREIRRYLGAVPVSEAAPDPPMDEGGGFLDEIGGFLHEIEQQAP